MPAHTEETTELPALPPSQLRLLLVEDDPVTLELLAAQLRADGYEVSTAKSAEEALAAISERFYSIVITDVHMPGMGGLALCRELRSAHLEGYIYIIAITASDSEEGAVAALEAGADDFIRKKVSRAEITARLQAAKRVVTLERQLRQMLDKQRQLAGSDSLTGLPNRRAFARQFNSEFKRALRFKEDLAVLIMDIDHFKSINDRYGHAAGDAALKLFALRLTVALPRAFDYAARLGGEEFAVMLPQTALAGAVHVAERLRQSIASEPFDIGEHRVAVTMSLGVSTLREHAETGTLTPQDLLEQADHRMYASKLAGRNRTTGDSPASPSTVP